MKTQSKYALTFVFLLCSSGLFAQHQQEQKIWQEDVSPSEVVPSQDINPANPANWWKINMDKPNSSVPQSSIQNEIKAYPNPSNGIFNVEIPTGTQKLSICSVSGATIFEMEIEGWEKVIPVDLTEYDAGTYFVFMSLEEIHKFLRMLVIK